MTRKSTSKRAPMQARSRPVKPPPPKLVQAITKMREREAVTICAVLADPDPARRMLRLARGAWQWSWLFDQALAKFDGKLNKQTGEPLAWAIVPALDWIAAAGRTYPDRDDPRLVELDGEPITWSHHAGSTVDCALGFARRLAQQVWGCIEGSLGVGTAQPGNDVNDDGLISETALARWLSATPLSLPDREPWRLSEADRDMLEARFTRLSHQLGPPHQALATVILHKDKPKAEPLDVDALARAFDRFYATLDATTVPVPGGARRVIGTAHAIALSEATQELHNQLAAAYHATQSDHGKQIEPPAWCVLLEADSPDGPWRTIPRESVTANLVPLGASGGGANAVLVAALDSAMQVTAYTPGEARAGAHAQRWRAGEVITAGDMATLESAKKLLGMIADGSGGKPRPIGSGVVAREFHVHRRTLSRLVTTGKLKDLRPPGHAKNAPLILDESEIRQRFTRR